MDNFHADETRDHYAQPAMAYISFPTESGTIYSASELRRIREVCNRQGLKFYIDGARLGYGLGADGNDVSPEFLAGICDAFYIGGTKVGALCGEAVVFPRGNAPEHFFTTIKRRGALLAKGRVNGIQFDALFTDGLYFKIGRHAVEMAMKLKEMFSSRGFSFASGSPTNQQFVILDNATVERLGKHVLFSHWAPYDEGHTICRFVTSWATTDKDLETLRRYLDE
jgi:threonine aldolase